MKKLILIAVLLFFVFGSVGFTMRDVRHDLNDEFTKVKEPSLVSKILTTTGNLKAISNRAAGCAEARNACRSKAVNGGYGTWGTFNYLTACEIIYDFCKFFS